MNILRVIGLLMLLLGASVALFAQQITGSIVGNVTDASYTGKVIFLGKSIHAP